jgi:hypothetical protein
MTLDDESLARRVQVMQVIVAALVMGVVLFGVVALVLNPEVPPVNADLPLVSLIAVGFSVLSVVGSFVVPNMLVRPLEEAGGGRDDGTLIVLYQTRLIIGASLCEGAALFTLIAYMMEGVPIILAATVFMLLLLIARFPIVSRVRDWLEQQRLRGG